MVLLLVMGSLIEPLPVSSPPPAMVRPPDGGSMMLPPWRRMLPVEVTVRPFATSRVPVTVMLPESLNVPVMPSSAIRRC